jgi:hypothetical protein
MLLAVRKVVHSMRLGSFATTEEAIVQTAVKDPGVTAGRSFHSFLLSMNSSLLLTSAAATRVVHGAAISTGLIARQVAAADGPGYRASNVVETVTGLTADLTLAGPACNVLGRDIQELKLSVNYETGIYARSALMISC